MVLGYAEKLQIANNVDQDKHALVKGTGKLLSIVNNTQFFSLNIFYSTEIQYTCSQTIQYIKLTKIILQKWIATEAKLIEFLSNFRLLHVQVTLFCYFWKSAA